MLVSATFVDESSRDGSTWHWVFTPFLVLTIVFLLNVYSPYSLASYRGEVFMKNLWSEKPQDYPGFSPYYIIMKNLDPTGLCPFTNCRQIAPLYPQRLSFMPTKVITGQPIHLCAAVSSIQSHVSSNIYLYHLLYFITVQFINIYQLSFPE
jgi:hypothetical protein